MPAPDAASPAPRPSSGHAVVVGGGVFGLTGALALLRRGWEVTLLDPGPLPHPRASSTDISKIVRMDYGGDAFFTAFAEAALEGWDRWNEAAPGPLYHQDGFLVLAGQPMASGGFEDASHRLLTARGRRLDRIGGKALEARFPHWRGAAFPDGYLNPRAGWAESGAVVAWLAGEAREEGLTMRREEVRRLRTAGGRVEGVELAGGGVVEGGVVVVAAGAWTPRIAPLPRGAMWATGQPVLHFTVDDPESWSPPAFVPWAADIGRTGWYGFPAHRGDGRGEGRSEGGGEGGDEGRGEGSGGEEWVVKVGHHGRGLPGPARDGVTVPDEHLERCRSFLREALPGLAARPVAARRVCWYCDTFDGSFWIDRHPEVDGLVVAAGGSGHGFKFGPLLGGIVADAVEDRENAWREAFRWREPSGRIVTEEARFRER